MSICDKIKKIIKDNLEEIVTLKQEKILKNDNSYVSKGDYLCEKLVKEFIKMELPDYALVSEESPEDNKQNWLKDKVIILDPIDGTENFVSGLKEWGVAVCVYEYSKHKESMLALPELDCYLKTGDKYQKYDSRIAGISSSLTKEDILKLEPGFEYRIIGCAVYNMYNVVTGSFHSFENPKGAKVWDIIPGLNLALENGLSVTVNNQEYHGELLDPNQKYIFKVQNR
ncbi:inositol monophosphatase family protein [Runella slithyformis]|uniref:Inositol monophosphatase n=1 Tax=Runella slithyformis (strain ATCC 29530 / DSM 19594 / LMG 11500 / NCIMB 11436 / LSU 4) TaxID=761193 RepID=A0A7U3ZPK4_RUNSL|nr:inositol monophosphatase family protein [Runella slithyformis]AEI51019.1 inositol monophosphatase [Runella slithyformis DSM 19594]